jgi:hypothetical protein
MTPFEQMLIDKGYEKYVFDCKTMKLEIAKGHVLSTIANLDHRYYHKSDVNKEQPIVFGLNESNKPPTLIYPRPRLRVNRNGLIQDERHDDNMNVALSVIPHEEILKAMYDKRIIFNIEL